MYSSFHMLWIYNTARPTEVDYNRWEVIIFKCIKIPVPYFNIQRLDNFGFRCGDASLGSLMSWMSWMSMDVLDVRGLCCHIQFQQQQEHYLNFTQC
jgi:hypothetical protein